MTEGMRLGARWRMGMRRLRGWRRGLDFALARRFGLATREDRLFFLLIPLVGLLAGVFGLVITKLIAVFQTALWGSGEEILTRARNAPAWLRVVAPAIGGTIVGLIAWRARAPVGGHGISRLLEAVALRGGRVPPKPALLSAAAAVATVGSGGSLGREGPMIGLGAMVASWLGDRAKLPAHRLKVLVGCGAAAGMAAIFNTPIGGALFAMEVILGNFALDIFGPVVVASVLSTFVARSFRGAAPIYAAPGYVLVSGWELLAYLVLGLVGAIVSVIFVHVVRLVANSFAKATWLPFAARPVVGMTLVGLIGLYVPYVFGNGFDTITLALHEKLPLVLLLSLPAAKLLATALTAGSGGAGGLFTPSLFLGALVGGAYGWGVHALWPDVTGPYGAYAAVGMAAIAAGTSHAPISAILILFEFTGNYDLILPLMLASITSSLLARKISRHSIYTEALARRGVDLSLRMEEAVLAGVSARDLMRPDTETLQLDDPYRRVVDRFLNTRRQRLFVLDGEGRLRGAVSLHDIKHTLAKPEQPATARDLMVPVPRALRETDRLHRAAEAFAQQDFERLPVVGEAGHYSGLLATFVSSDGAASRNYVELPPDFSVRRVELPQRFVSRTLEESRWPQTTGTRVLEILRGGGTGAEERVIPEARTRLESGDALLLLGPTAAIEALERGEIRQSEAEVRAGID
jgi:CIC family chloride channel protein